MNKKIVKNLIFYGAYQVLLPLMSLFSQSHITTVFEPTQLGLYALTNTVVLYFVVYTGYEMNKYGVKVIASVNNDRVKLTEMFNKVYKVQFSNGLLSIAIYLVFVTFFTSPEYQMLYYIQTLFLVATMVDIFWLYAGIEKMGIISLRNIVMQTITVSLIVLGLSNPSQLLLYALIVAGMALITNLTLWLSLKRQIIEINFWRYKLKDLNEHIKNAGKLLIPHLIIYSIIAIDKLILGIVSGKSEVGYYEKVIGNLNIIILFICSLGIVLLPMMNNLRTKNLKMYREQSSFFITSIVIVSSIVAMLVITQVEIFKLIYDQNNWDFQKVSTLFKIGSLLIIITGTAQLIVNIIIIPCNLNRLIIINSIITFLFAAISYYIGSKFGNSEGLMIAKIATEGLFLGIFIYFIKKHQNIQLELFEIVKNTILIIGIVIGYEQIINQITIPLNLILKTIIQTLIILIIYLTGAVILRIKLINYLFDQLKTKFKTKGLV